MLPKDPSPDADRERRLEIFERAKRFEDDVADVFQLLGYQATVDYKLDDMQFDVRGELPFGLVSVHVLVECKDLATNVGQRDVREFASKVEYARNADDINYQAVLVARTGFANNAHVVAKKLRVQIRTFQQLLLSLVDLTPHMDDAVRGYDGTELERLYVEQDVLLQSDRTRRRPLLDAVREWIERTGALFRLYTG